LCGYPFEEGRKYLVYAKAGKVNVCSRMRALPLAEADLSVLGDPSRTCRHDSEDSVNPRASTCSSLTDLPFTEEVP
jgi:hypothetical protein